MMDSLLNQLQEEIVWFSGYILKFIINHEELNLHFKTLLDIYNIIQKSNILQDYSTIDDIPTDLL